MIAYLLLKIFECSGAFPVASYLSNFMLKYFHLLLFLTPLCIYCKVCFPCDIFLSSSTVYHFPYLKNFALVIISVPSSAIILPSSLSKDVHFDRFDNLFVRINL